MRNKEERKDSISKPHPGSSGTLEIVIPKIDIIASPDIIEVIEATATNQLQAGSSSQEITPSKEELQELSAENYSKENRTNESKNGRKHGRDDEERPASKHPKSEPPPKRPQREHSFNQSFINFYNSSEGLAKMKAFKQEWFLSIEASKQSRHVSESDAKTEIDTATEERNRQSPRPG